MIELNSYLKNVKIANLKAPVILYFTHAGFDLYSLPSSVLRGATKCSMHTEDDKLC